MVVIIKLTARFFSKIFSPNLLNHYAL